MRYMYDAKSINAGLLVSKNPEMIAIYLTGTPDIRWTSVQVALFPNVKTFVRIDQGGITSPQYAATVFDAEPRAWTIPGAIAATERSTAPRPTVYCDRSDYQTIPASYKRDIWLAAPGLSDAEAIALSKADPRIVAVQNVFTDDWDKSVVLDPYWPEKAPIVTTPDETVTQIEYYKNGFGWVLPPNGTIKFPVTGKIRVRTGKAETSGGTVAVPGTWSQWQEINVD